jgi:hypothetical protein
LDRCPAATVNYTLNLSSQRVPHVKKSAIVYKLVKGHRWVPDTKTA